MPKKYQPKTHSTVEGQPPTHFVKIWDFINTYRKENDVSPSLAEYVKAKLASSTSVINYYLTYMIEAGMVKKAKADNKRAIIPLPRTEWGVWVNPPVGVGRKIRVDSGVAEQ